MGSRIVKPLPDRPAWFAVAQAYRRALRAGRRLPPGDLSDIGEGERVHRTLLLDRGQRYGPVFKGLMERRLTVCVIGHSLSRRLLKDHASVLQPVSIRLEALFPHGFMRRMEGSTHRDYRKALVQGVHGLDIDSFATRAESIAARELAAHAADPRRGASYRDWSELLARIAASSLIELFFGPEPGHPAHERLLAAYEKLGPHGVVWHVTSRQIDAFEQLRAAVSSLGSDAGGLLGGMLVHGELDATLLGNLVYMVELGRYDLRGLLRWITRYAADHPAWLARIAGESRAPAPDGSPSAAEAFVLETLRLDQSERLMREVKDDFVFDGWLIPKGAQVRACMWEAHKDVRSFPQPFVFDPDRFLAGAARGDAFSPFGLDHHHCPFAGASVQIGVAYLRALASRYDVRQRGAEPAVRGPYHWEPSPRLEITLAPRVRNGG